jgi:hypothetical protein
MAAYRLAVVCDRLKTRARCSGSGSGGQRFVEDPVAADAFDGDAVPPQVPVEVVAGNGLDSEGGLLGDQDVPVRGAGPGRATMAEPVPEGFAGEFAESLGVPGDGDAPVGQVKVIQREMPDRSRAGVDRGQGDDESLCRADGHPFDGADLGVGHRQQAVPSVTGLQARGGLVKTRPRFLANRSSDRSAAMAVRSWWPRSGTWARVTSRRWPWSADQRSMSGRMVLK